MKCSECAHDFWTPSDLATDKLRCKLCSGTCRRCKKTGALSFRSGRTMCPACWECFRAKWAKAGLDRDAVLRRFPHLCAHVICCSLGYATPEVAAKILLDALLGEENWCEWIYSCWQRNPALAVAAAVEFRKGHKGYMSEIRQAVALVRHVVEKGQPAGMLASWF